MPGLIILACKYIMYIMDIIEFASLGGQARAKSLSASRRKEIAVKAIHTRWGNTCKQVKNKPKGYCLEHKVLNCKKCS